MCKASLETPYGISPLCNWRIVTQPDRPFPILASSEPSMEIGNSAAAASISADAEMADYNETDARIIIDRMLREAGWDPEDKMQVKTEVPSIARAVVREVDEDRQGRCDYVLSDRNGRPLAIV